MAKYQNSRYYPGRILADNADGTYNIKYEDGSLENGVKKFLVRDREDTKISQSTTAKDAAGKREQKPTEPSPQGNRSIIKPTKIITHKSHHRASLVNKALSPKKKANQNSPAVFEKVRSEATRCVNYSNFI
jgi:hypothetical protein